MPPKVRELISQLEANGFQNRGGKGSHRNFTHPNVVKLITISGKAGEDAKPLSNKGCEKSYREIATMKDSARYIKIVEWSEEDQCYVGSSPGLFMAGCHGDDEESVFHELCSIVEETISIYKADGKELPPATSGKGFANVA